MNNMLTEKQKGYPYAKYFEFPFDDPKIPEDLWNRINPQKPMDPEKALQITEINKLLDPGYQAEDEGYCILSDGAGYVGEKMFYPGVTKEMFEWWFAWHGIEDSRYKIWDPKAHYGVAVSKRNLRQRTDSSLSWKERNWGTTDFIMAYTTEGPSVMRICFMSPEDFGFDMQLLKKNNVSCVCAISGKPDEAVCNGPSIRVLHETEDGLHVWLYFWYGYTIVNRKPIRLDTGVCDIEVPKLQVTHCAEEYTRLGKILPLVYKENHMIKDRADDFQPMPF